MTRQTTLKEFVKKNKIQNKVILTRKELSTLAFLPVSFALIDRVTTVD